MRTAMLRRATRLAWLAAQAMVLALPSARAAEGLSVDPDSAFGTRWSARMSITSTSAPGTLQANASNTRTQAARILGDFYLQPRAGAADGGLRLTSGLFVGPRGALFGATAPLAGAPGRVALGHQRLATAGLDAAPDSVLAWPYLGLGYSSASLREGWGFNADLGLAAQNAGALRLGRMFSPGLDDMLREMRLRPVLQVGVSYAF